MGALTHCLRVDTENLARFVRVQTEKEAQYNYFALRGRQARYQSVHMHLRGRIWVMVIPGIPPQPCLCPALPWLPAQRLPRPLNFRSAALLRRPVSHLHEVGSDRLDGHRTLTARSAHSSDGYPMRLLVEAAVKGTLSKYAWRVPVQPCAVLSDRPAACPVPSGHMVPGSVGLPRARPDRGEPALRRRGYAWGSRGALPRPAPVVSDEQILALVAAADGLNRRQRQR